MKTGNIFIVDYAYGFDVRTCEPDHVAKLRLQAGLRALQKYPQAHIILGAGMKEVTGDCGPLAEIMNSFLIENGISPEKIILNPTGHDTLTETEAACTIIKRRGDGKIICATSAFHALRVWLIWFCRFGRLPTIYTTPIKPHWFDYLHEFRKVPRDVIRSLMRIFEN